MCGVLVVFIFFYGILKLMGGIDFIVGMVIKVGLFLVFVYFVYVGEVVVFLMILLGVWIWIVVLIIVVNMFVVVLLVYMSEFFILIKMGGWVLEL